MLITKRLDLVEATPDSVRAALGDYERLGELLHARIPREWPPELLDAGALQWTLNWLSVPTNDPAFGMYWIVLRGGDERVLVGVAGFKGMPTDGVVEIGYGVVPEFQRRGFATEAVRAFVKHAFARPDVARVTAETYPHLVASIGVLEKCGFRLEGEGSEAGVVRYVRTAVEGVKS